MLTSKKLPASSKLRSVERKMTFIPEFGFSIYVYADCYEVHNKGGELPGFYIIQTGPNRVYTRVHCLEEGWTVIQSRGPFGNSRDYFLKGWEHYLSGFGVAGK